MNILEIKLSLNVTDSATWAEGTEALLEARLAELETTETMIHMWSWAVFPIKSDTPKELVAEIDVLNAAIFEITTELGINQ